MSKYVDILASLEDIEREVHMAPAIVGSAENKALADASVSLHDAKRAIQRAESNASIATTSVPVDGATQRSTDMRYLVESNAGTETYENKADAEAAIAEEIDNGADESDFTVSSLEERSIDVERVTTVRIRS